MSYMLEPSIQFEDHEREYFDETLKFAEELAEKKGIKVRGNAEHCFIIVTPSHYHNAMMQELIIFVNDKISAKGKEK